MIHDNRQLELSCMDTSLVPRPPLAAFFAAVEKNAELREEAWLRGYMDTIHNSVYPHLVSGCVWYATREHLSAKHDYK